MPNKPIAPAAVSVAQAANYLGLSRASVYRLAAQGRLPLRKIFDRTLVAVADLDQLLEDAAR